MVEVSRFWSGTTVGDAGPYSALNESDTRASLWRNELEPNLNNIGHVAGSGATATTDPLDVTETSPISRAVSVNIGEAWMFGVYYENEAPLTLSIASNTSGSTRIDSVVLRMDWTAQTIRLAVLEGIAPTQIQNTLWEHVLAEVTVINGALSISNSDIDDSFNIPLQRVMYTTETTANTTAPSAFTGLWSGNQLKAAPLNTVQFTDDSLLFLSTDNGANWYGIVDGSNQQEQLNQSGTVGSADTTLASVNLQVTGIRPVVIYVGFYAPLNASATPVVKIKEDSTAIFTVSGGSILLSTAFIHKFSYIYTPSASGNKTISVTAAVPPTTTPFSGAYIIAMEV